MVPSCDKSPDSYVSLFWYISFTHFLGNAKHWEDGNRGYVSRCRQKSPKWSLSPNPQGWQRSQMLCLWVGARAKKRYVRFHRCIYIYISLSLSIYLSTQSVSISSLHVHGPLKSGNPRRWVLISIADVCSCLRPSGHSKVGVGIGKCIARIHMDSHQIHNSYPGNWLEGKSDGNPYVGKNRAFGWIVSLQPLNPSVDHVDHHVFRVFRGFKSLQPLIGL